jgi:YVTN family beta-propeller protein
VIVAHLSPKLPRVFPGITRIRWNLRELRWMMDGVSSGLAPARTATYRRIRLAVVAASVVAAIVGSVLLATNRSRDHVGDLRGSVSAPGLPEGGKVVARIRVGRGGLPLKGGGALAVGEGAVWAMSNSQATLMRIDPARNAVVARIKKVYPPETVAAGDGAVWLSNPSDDTVTRIDPSTNKVTATIQVGPSPEGIAVSPGAVWVATAGGPSVSRIDPATNRVVATIAVGPKRACCAEHMSVIASPRAVWVAVPYGKRLVRINPATNRVVASAPLDYEPCGSLAADGTGVWSSGCGPGVVARVDARTNELTAARVPEVQPAGLEVAFGSVWVADHGSGNVDQIDPRTGRLVARLHVSGLIVRLGAAFGSIWVNDDFGRVLRIKPQR